MNLYIYIYIYIYDLRPINSFYDNVIMHGFIPHTTLLTRLSDTCGTLIDIMFANNVGVNHVNGVLSPVLSDHK